MSPSKPDGFQNQFMKISISTLIPPKKAHKGVRNTAANWAYLCVEDEIDLQGHWVRGDREIERHAAARIGLLYVRHRMTSFDPGGFAKEKR